MIENDDSMLKGILEFNETTVEGGKRSMKINLPKMNSEIFIFPLLEQWNVLLEVVGQ